MSIGNNLKNLRKNRGLSQELLAEKIGVSRQAVSKWETDATIPSTANLIKLADILGVDLTALTSDGILVQEKLLTFNHNLFYILGAIICLLGFMIGIYLSETSPIFIALGVLSPMGMTYFFTKINFNSNKSFK